MNCKNCNNFLPDGAKFCGKCGTKILRDASEIGQTIKTKTAKGVRISAGIIVALIVFGILVKAIMIIANAGAVLIGVDSVEGLKTAEAIANIVGLLGGAYLADSVYTSIAGKDRLSEKKKWYQFAGFTSIANKTRMSRPILAGVIMVIIVIAVVLSMSVDSMNTPHQKGVDLGQVTSSNDNWIIYNAPESNFSVKIPSRPVHDTSNQDTANGKVKIDSYKTADDTASVAYIVNVTEFPQGADLSDPSGILENTVNLSAKNGTIVTSNPITHSGYQAIDYLIQFDHEKTISRIRGLNILVGQRLYQLLAAYDKTEETKLEFEKFTESFEIK